jgi:hypothetical protein
VCMVLMAVSLGVAAPRPLTTADQGQPCEAVPMPCIFEAPPFKIKVVHAETREPLVDVHALAEWQVYGGSGRLNGPLMVLDALSDGAGILSFPGWGPIQGSMLGMGIGRDPVVTLFKSGYKPLVVNNGYLSPAKEYERIRHFAQNGRTFSMEPFRGTQDQWLKELTKIYRGVAFPRSDDDTLRFREPYLNRVRRVQAELERLPEPIRAAGRKEMLIDRDIRLLERRPR